jgi:hypothetical protein
MKLSKRPLKRAIKELKALRDSRAAPDWAEACERIDKAVVELESLSKGLDEVVEQIDDLEKRFLAIRNSLNASPGGWRHGN